MELAANRRRHLLGKAARATRQEKDALPPKPTPPPAPRPVEAPPAQAELPAAAEPAASEAKKRRKRGSPGGRNHEQTSTRAKEREAKQLAWRAQQIALEEQAEQEERTRRAEEEAAQAAKHPEPQSHPAPLPVPPEIRDEADLDDTIPVMKRIPRPNGTIPRTLHLDIDLNKELTAWMAREGGLVFIPAMTGLVRAMLHEDSDYRDRVKAFESANGRPPTAAEVRRGAIHQAVQIEVQRMVEGEPFPPTAGA